ncbi:hypothetical protein AB0B97_04675 [Micromonospora sp. NPDC049004]|uniref:hypothetical protein n=1 Tax=Micromonospora sp. NPDC049004 TaxID=3154348 RepID=UPI0033C08B10
MNLRKLVIAAAWTIPVVAIVCAGAGFLLVQKDAADRRACQESVNASQAKVRTDAWDPPADLPGVGTDPEIHWQVRPLSNPCSFGPGPTDWAYQGVVNLRPEDARVLADQYDFVPYATLDPDELPLSNSPADVWPALASYLPDKPRWQYSSSYSVGSHVAELSAVFLDVEHHTLFFHLLNS